MLCSSTAMGNQMKKSTQIKKKDIQLFFLAYSSFCRNQQGTFTSGETGITQALPCPTFLSCSSSVHVWTNCFTHTLPLHQFIILWSTLKNLSHAPKYQQLDSRLWFRIIWNACVMFLWRTRWHCIVAEGHELQWNPHLCTSFQKNSSTVH